MIELLDIKKLFKRPRYNERVIFLSFTLRVNGSSFRRIQDTIIKTYDTKVSHIAIYKWVKRISKYFKPNNQKKKRKILLIDETVIKYKGRRRYFWVVLDPINKEVVATWLSRERSFDEVSIILYLINKYAKGLEEIIFITDKGPWYNLLEEKGLRRIKLKFHVRGYIERFFRYIKEVIKRFDNQGFQSKDLKYVKGFLDVICFEAQQRLKAIHSKKVKVVKS